MSSVNHNTTNHKRKEKAMLKHTRIPTLHNIATSVQKIITMSTKTGLWARSHEGETPTKEAIRGSIPWAMIGLTDYDEINFVTDIVYPKLRKNGILAKLR
jgi:hypothetical protein